MGALGLSSFVKEDKRSSQELKEIYVGFGYRSFGGDSDRPRIPNVKILHQYLMRFFGRAYVSVEHERESSMYFFTCRFSQRESRRIYADLVAYREHHVLRGYRDRIMSPDEIARFSNLNHLLDPFIERLMTPQELEDRSQRLNANAP